MKISDKLIPLIVEFIEKEFDYKVNNFGDANAMGYYRPRVTNSEGKTSQNLSLRVISSTKIYIQDWAGDSLILDVTNFKPTSTSEMTNEERETLHKLKEEDKKRAKDLFKTNLSELFNKPFEEVEKMFKDTIGKATVPLDHNAVEYKKLIPYSVLEVNPMRIAVPYFKNLEGTLGGVQLRTQREKIGVTGSSLTGAFCIVRKGVFNATLGTQTVIVTESWSTGCSIAQVRKEDMVVAASSINQVVAVCQYFLSKDGYSVVAAIDKTKNNENNIHMNKVIHSLRYNHIPFIQPDISFLNMTDYNDIRVKKGLPILARELQIQLGSKLPIKPEVLSTEEVFFQMWTPLGNKIRTVNGTKLDEDMRRTVASEAYWYALQDSWHSVLPVIRRIYKWDLPPELPSSEKDKILDENKKKAAIYEKDFQRKLFEYLTEEASRVSSQKLKSLGIFKEDNGYVLNSKHISMYEKDGKIHPVVTQRPLDGNTYIRDASNTLELEDSDKLTKKDLKKVYECASAIVGSTEREKQYFLSVIGFAVQATYCSFSSYRPSMWLTGRSGSGKSSVYAYMVKTLLRGMCLGVDDATKGGLMQYINPQNNMENGILLAYEEAAADSKQKADTIEEIIKMSRAMATRDEGSMSLRGTKDQQVKTYSSRASFMLSSTEHSLKDIQDLSRYFLLDIKPSQFNDAPANFDNLKEACETSSPRFLKMLLAEAKHFDEHVKLVSNMVSEQFSHVDLRQLSHKKRTLVFVVAGLSILLKHTNNWSSKKSCKQAFLALKTTLEDQVSEHLALVETNTNLLETLLGTQVRYNNMTRSLLFFLLDEELKVHFRIVHGIWVDFKKENAFLCIERYGDKASKFFSNRSICSPCTYGLQNSLRELPNHKCKETRKRIGNERPVVYELPVSIDLITLYTGADDGGEVVELLSK